MSNNAQRLIYLVFCLFILAPSSQAQFVNFELTWKEFLADAKTSNISKLPKPSKEIIENYMKWHLMYANNYFCSGIILKSEDMMSVIKELGETKYNSIPGFKEKHDDLAIKIQAYHKVEALWQKFLKTRNVTLDDLKVEAATKVCEKGTLAKYFHMTAHAQYCNKDLKKAKGAFENRVLKIVENTSLKMDDVPGLEDEVAMTKALFAGLEKLDASWADFVKTGETEGFETDLPLIKCQPIPNIKKHVLIGASDICNKGPKQLKKIAELEAMNSDPIPDDLQKKLAWLKKEVGKYTGDIAKLEKSWKEFVPSDKLKNGIDFGFEYCFKDAVIKAYTMVGTIEACTRGQEMLDSIANLREAFKPALDKVVIGKIENLEKIVKGFEDDLENLAAVWKDFVANDDTLTTPFKLADFYCDKIAQVRSLTIKGHFDYCAKGQGYLDQIDALTKKHSLEYDEELDCRILRLRIKVWDCRYWELVLQARKETNEERERFGPSSSKIMQTDLNSDKQPCETKVQYSPVEFIGVKYVISTFLCQDIDLAKMGDPEYYKKIATWVDTEVLTKYCEANMRCKEDFYIYLEGHTDGNAFRGARYKKSLDIPVGTKFTHYVDNTANEKVVEKEITTSLKSNMELGIARAWTVKQQLDFMGVPIFIGAWEHPASEKGGQYRRIEIELNIPNLLLDFYEKLLARLVEESGIGERPEMCGVEEEEAVIGE